MKPLRTATNIWSIIAVICVLAATILFFTNRLNATFVVATLGVVAWFINQKNIFRAQIEADEPRRETHKEVNQG